MGMTIEEAMEFLENSKHLIAPSKEPNLGNACDVAITTMRKYQRIQTIVEAWKADTDIDSYDCMTDIYEVVEDENINYKATV